MDEKKEEQDGSNADEQGKTTEGQSEMAQPQDEDPLKKAFKSALNQNVADSELAQQERAVTDGNAMTARDDAPQQSPGQDTNAANGAGVDQVPPSDNEEDSTPGPAVIPVAKPTQGASPVISARPVKKGKTGLQEREMTAMDEHNQEQPPSSDTGEETIAKEPKRKSAKRKKKKTKRKRAPQEPMAPPPFYQFPFFGLLPQVQAQERRKRAKKKSKPSNPVAVPREDPVPSPAKTAAPAHAPSHDAAPKKIEAVKIQQKEDDNGYLNLADLQAEEKKLYGEERKIGAPGEEYICLADANEAAAPPPAKDGSSTGPSGGQSSKPPETAAKSPAVSKSPLPKDEFQDAVLTPRPGQQQSAAVAKTPPPPKDAKKPSLASESMGRKQREAAKKAGGQTTLRPGPPVLPRPLQQSQPAPAGSVGPNKTKTPAPSTSIAPNKGQATKRKTPVIPVRPPPPPTSQKRATPTLKKSHSNTKDEFQDAVLTPINKNPPKGGGTRR